MKLIAYYDGLMNLYSLSPRNGGGCCSGNTVDLHCRCSVGIFAGTSAILTGFLGSPRSVEADVVP
jgi:hypothetical protein